MSINISNFANSPSTGNRPTDYGNFAKPGHAGFNWSDTKKLQGF